MDMHITFPNPNGGAALIEIDGGDISKHVRQRDFRIGFENAGVDPDDPILRPVVHLALRPTRIIVEGEIPPHEEFTLALAERADHGSSLFSTGAQS